MKEYKFPPQEELDRVREELKDVEGSSLLAPDASDLERIKFEICKAFVKYVKKYQISQRDLAKELEVDESIVSKLLHYKIESFTVDRLVKYLGKV